MDPSTVVEETNISPKGPAVDRLPVDMRDSSVLALPTRLCNEYPYPDILSMSAEDRKKLSNGVKTQVCMLAPEGNVQVILDQTIAVVALAALSPVIREAMESSPFMTDPIRLERIVLPHGHIEAYKLLFDGLKELDMGEVNSFKTPPNAPLFHTYNLLTICQNLGIRHIVEETQRIYDFLSTQQFDRICIIDPEDIRHAYRDFPIGHPLQKAVVEKVAWGLLYGQLHGTPARQVCEVEEEIKEFHEDLMGRRYELQVEGEEIQAMAVRSRLQ